MCDVVLSDFGSFHIGGRRVELTGLPLKEVHYSPTWVEQYDPNGSYIVEQMYVQYLIPKNAQTTPLIFWPGGGLTGVNFETTPDGRSGWVSHFLAQGYPVYNTDPVERGRSGWAMYPEIFKEAPTFMTEERGFESFRFGLKDGFDVQPDRRKVMPHTQFPVEAYHQFIKQIVPRWTSNGTATITAYHLLLERLGQSVIVAFSSGATQALQLAAQYPQLLSGLVLIEPANVGEGVAPAAFKDLPILVVYGDFLDKHAAWPDIRARMGRYFAPVTEPVGQTTVVDLPLLGMTGNSHFLMMDKNNHEISAFIGDWLTRKVS